MALILQFVVVPAPPDFDASGAEVRDYLVDNRTGVLVSSVLQLLAALFFVLFLVGLRDVVRRGRDGDYWSACTVIGGVLVGATVLGAQSIFAGPLWIDGAAEQMSDDVLRLAWSTAYLLYGAAAPGMLLVTGTVALAGLRDHVTPTVTAWIGLLAAVLSAVAFVMQLDSEFGALALTSFPGLILFAFANAIPMARGKVPTGG